MSGTFGLGYLIWVLLVAGLGVLLRIWYTKDPRRSQLAFWLVLMLACPPLALVIFLLLKMVRIRVVQ